MNTQTAKNNQRRNGISGVLVSKIDRAHLAGVLKDLNLDFDDDATDEQLSIIAFNHFDSKTKADDKCQCDACFGVSTVDLDACPYCGDSGEVQEEKAAPPAVVTAPATIEDPQKVLDAAPKDEPATASPKKGKRTMATTSETTTKKNGKANGVNGASTAMVVHDAKELDAAVSEIRTLQSDGAVAMWRLGERIKHLYDKQLWKQRVEQPAKGAPKQVYKSFDKFCHEELGMTPASAYSVMDVAAHFEEKQVAALGTSRLALVLQAPEPQQPKLLKKVEEGATWRELKQEVSAIKKKSGHRRPPRAGAKANRNTEAASKARTTTAAKQITVAKLLGRETVKLYCKPTTKKFEIDDLKPAKKIGDAPYGRLELINGVLQEFFVQQGSDGSIKLIVHTSRAE